MLSSNRDHHREKLGRCLRLTVALCASLTSLIVSLLLLSPRASLRAGALPPDPSDYEMRKAALLARAAQPFADDPVRDDDETDLDWRPFHQINELSCAKLITSPTGWSVEVRTGGRPFLNFDDILVNGVPWDFTPCSPGDSGIPQHELDDHYAAGKTVNRFWLIHRAGEGDYPTVVVMTPDGFFNAAGAEIPLRLGAALRTGFIGEPFSDVADYLQHVDEVSFKVIDDDTLIVTYDVHSEAGEGVLEVEVRWIEATRRPELHFRSAHVPRLEASLGFAGFNFMRGPTLSGLPWACGGPEAGIEAFHDGRSVFLVHRSGAIARNLLIPPPTIGTVVREDIAASVVTGSKLVMDQPQNVAAYFSKVPTPPYEHRTDLVLKLDDSTVESISARRAQVAVDLEDVNPEARETANVFLAADMATENVYEFAFTLELAAEDYEQLYQARGRGVVFVSDRYGLGSRLYFLPLDEEAMPAGSAEPLTDGVIEDPRRPSVSADGRFVIFDADSCRSSTSHRVHTLDLFSAAVRRLTVDPAGASNDWGASLNAEGTRFAMISDRRGMSHLTIEEVASGLSCGFGNYTEPASSGDWSHTRDEIAYASGTGLQILDVETGLSSSVVASGGIGSPRFSPSGERIAYVAPTGLYVVSRDGIGITQVMTDGESVTWVDDDRWIVQRTAGGNTDLYLLDLGTGDTVRLTMDPGADREPAFVRAVGPTIGITSPSSDAHLPEGDIGISGVVASAGVPTVTVNGTAATVLADGWGITLTLGAGIHPLTAQVIDSENGLTAEDRVTVTVSGRFRAFLPLVMRER